MVASFADKAVTKSYVRLPGSGSDKEARASFCDLSRGSSLAASIPVPQPLGIPRTLQKRPRNEESTNDQNKRPRLDTTTPNVGRPSVISKPVSVPVAPQPVSVTVAPVMVQHQVRSSTVTPTTNTPNSQTGTSNPKPTKYIIISNTEQDIKNLKDKNDSLRTENAALRKQISLFKQIFRDPKKHESFLRQFLPEQA